MFPFAFQFLRLHHKLICIFDTMRLSTLHCLYWIWWVSLSSTTTSTVIYLTPHAYLDMDTMSLYSSVHLLSCKYPFPHLSPSTTFLMPIFSPDFLPLPASACFCQSHFTSPSSLHDCPFFLVSKLFTPSNLFSTFLVLIFNPDTLYDVSVACFQPWLPPASPSSLQWMPVLSCKYPVP